MKRAAKSRARSVLVAAILAAARPGAAADAPASAATPRADIEATLADVSFLSGRWLEEEGGTLSEETWSAPAGDSMVGMWRLAQDGRAKLFELLTLVAEEGKVTLRLRHFDRRGVAWEEKDRPLVLPLVAREKGSALFEGEGKGGLLRLTYRREGDVLVVRLEKAGEPPADYRFRRAL
ncbi:MAG: DUF6265 family protein [Thermoanaerobaculia bacterium]